MAYAGGIGQEIDQLKDLSVQELVRRQNLDPSLIYTIALQERQKMDAAGARQGVLDEPKPQGTVTGRMEQELAQQTMPQSPLNRVAPGVMQQGQRSMQPRGPQMAQGPQTARGISGVPANNMGAIGRARGGIIEYAKGGSIPVSKSNQPIPMLMEKYGAERVNQFIAEQKRLNDKARALAEAGPAAGSMQIEDHKLMKQVFSEKYRDILNESMGMARGGVVGYAPGGRIKGFEERVVAADEQVRAYLSSLGRDIADFTAEQIAGIKDMLNSPVAQSQNDIMRQVGRGAMGAIADAETSMSQGQIGAREAQLESDRGGIGSVLSNLGSMVNSEDAQAARQELQQVMQGTNREPSVTDQLLAAEQRRIETNLTDEERAQRDKYNPVAYQQRLREQDMGRRDPNYGRQEAPALPEEGGGIRNALKGIFNSDDAAVARQELQQAMQGTGSRGQESEGGPSLYDRTKGYMPDFGALAGTDVMEFLVGMGLDDVAQKVMDSGFMSGVPTIEEMTTPIPEGAGGSYKAGARLTDLATAPYNVLSGFLRPTEGDWATLGDAVGGIEDFGRGVVGADPKREEVAEDIQQIDTETDANGAPTYDPMKDVNAVADPNLRRAIEGTQDSSTTTPATTPVASSATTPVSGFTADQTDRFGKMMQGIKDENFLDEYVGTISPNGDAGTGAATQKTGLAGLLQKVKPYADKASGIAKILGRGAGASEGFEFSQIAQKSAEREAEDRLAARNAEIADKLFSRQTERDTTGFEQQKTLDEMGIEASMDELTYRVDKAAELADTELTAQMRTDLVVAMQSDAALSNALEAMKGDYTTGGGDFIPFNERFDAEGYNKAAFKLRDEWLADQMRLIRPGQTSTAPATERYSVSES